MRKLFIYLLISALTLAITTPAVAQAPQGDQYINGSGPYSCADYYNFEIPGEIPEECAFDDGRDAVPEAGNSSNQTLEGLSNALSGTKSNSSAAVAEELDEPASKSEPAKASKPDSKDDSEDKGTDKDKDKDTERNKDKESFAGITELPDTGGATLGLLGAGVMLVAGSLLAVRKFR